MAVAVRTAMAVRAAGVGMTGQRGARQFRMRRGRGADVPALPDHATRDDRRGEADVERQHRRQQDAKFQGPGPGPELSHGGNTSPRERPGSNRCGQPAVRARPAKNERSSEVAAYSTTANTSQRSASSGSCRTR
jgi:hypothetical protein